MVLGIISYIYHFSIRFMISSSDNLLTRLNMMLLRSILHWWLYSNLMRCSMISLTINLIVGIGSLSVGLLITSNIAFNISIAISLIILLTLIPLLNCMLLTLFKIQIWVLSILIRKEHLFSLIISFFRLNELYIKIELILI